MVALLVLAIIAGSVASTLFAIRTSAEVERRRGRERSDSTVGPGSVAELRGQYVGAFAAFQNREVALVRTRLAAAPQEHRNWEWDLLQGMVEVNEQVIQAHDSLILSFAASPDGARWATGSQDGVVRVWDSGTGQMIADIAPVGSTRLGAEGKPPMVTALAFRQGASQIVAGTSDGAIRIWDAHAGRLILKLAGHRANITSLSVRPDGLIASTCGRNQARLWDGQRMRALGEINDEQSEISGLQFCAEGQLLVTWEPLGSIWLRDAETRQPIHRYRFQGSLRRVAASQDGSLIAAGGQDNRLQLWQSESTEVEGRTLEIPGSRSSTDSLCFSLDNQWLAVGRIDRRIVLLALDDVSKSVQLQGHEEFVRGLSYEPSGQRLISASGDGTLRIWNLEAHPSGSAQAIAEYQHRLGALAIAPAGDRIAVAAGDRTIGIYDRQLRPQSRFPAEHLGQIMSLAWSPREDKLASAGIDRSVRLWDAQSGESVMLSPAHAGVIRRLAFSPDGRWLVSAGADRALRIWNVATGEREGDLLGHGATVSSLRFSQDGRWLASGAEDGSTILWDWTTRTIAHPLVGHRSDVFALAFDPGGQRLYSGSRDRTIHVWSTSDGTVVDVLTGHGQLIHCLDLHPDGSRLVAGSWFGDIMFWDLQRHELVGTSKGHEDIVCDLAFSPTGATSRSCSFDQTLRKFERAAQHE